MYLKLSILAGWVAKVQVVVCSIDDVLEVMVIGAG